MHRRDIFLDITFLHQSYSLRSVIQTSLSPFQANNANANNSMRSKLIMFKPQLTDYLFLTSWPWLTLLPSNSSVKSRTYRDNKILRNLFSTFAALWLTKPAAYVPYKMCRTYGSHALPKWMVCKSKWQTKPLCTISVVVDCVIEGEIQWCSVLCYPYYIQQAETRSRPFFLRIIQFQIRSFDKLNCWHSFVISGLEVSIPFLCFRCCSEQVSWLSRFE